MIPVAATGGIHLDGFADTSDALSSYGDREKKLAILKDPHCGAFAVIRLCGYFVLYFALCACLRFTPRVGAVWTLALVLERAFSGYAVATFPMAKNTGLAHTFATAADKRRVQIVLLAVSVCVGAGMALLGGGLLALAALAVLWRYRAVAAKQFGGITGDLAGWFLQRAELVMLAALLISEGWNRVIFITGPLYSGKRTFAGKLGGRQIFDVQNLAAQADDLEWLADELAADYDVAAATEIGGGIVPMDAGERRAPGGGRAAGLPAGGARGHGDRDVLRHSDRAQGGHAMLIVLLRHGQTAYNEQRRYQGAADVPLSPAGRAALKKADFETETVYVTPLCRTEQTARILFPHARQIVVPALREMDFGVFEGRTYDEMEGRRGLLRVAGFRMRKRLPEWGKQGGFLQAGLPRV